MFSPRTFLTVASLCIAAAGFAQDVGLPAPRLLTVTPIGGQAGTIVEVAITGEYLEGAEALLFSTAKITAQPKRGADGKPETNHFTLTIAPDAPRGVYDARVLTRLGVSSARAFSVGTLPEQTPAKSNHSRETALEMKVNSVCNAATTKRAVDFYAFDAVKGKRLVAECAAAGIDSKLTPVILLADADGRDLLANRTDGWMDFVPPADGRYFIKIHSLTFQGGPEQFYRLTLRDAPADDPVPRQPATESVSAFSWHDAAAPTAAPVNATRRAAGADAQPIILPCVIAGSFDPAQVDTFSFAAKKGETWWLEVASARLGLPTNPFVLVQRATSEGGAEKWADVAEFDDIASPVKTSSNGYSYDGPPYEAGSADPMGKIEIKEDGNYRLQVRDLFAGTRADPSRRYRLLLRSAAPDFSLTGWALHMTLRNGDRNALSKPIALRGGATMAFEIVTVRKDGFDGEINLAMEDLPAGVTARGLKIRAGKNTGMMLITAAENAPRGWAVAKLVGRARIGGAEVAHTFRLASMAWPVKDASQEIPRPRLTADTPVSVGGAEFAPVSIAPAEDKVWTATAGEKLTIPLKATWRGEFAGTSLKLKAMSDGLEGVKEIDLPLKAPGIEVVLDLAAMKTPPGDYTLAFSGPAVIKYRALDDAPKLADAAKTEKTTPGKSAAMSPPAKDTADIVVSEPIRISIKAAPQK